MSAFSRCDALMHFTRRRVNTESICDKLSNCRRENAAVVLYLNMTEYGKNVLPLH